MMELVLSLGFLAVVAAGPAANKDVNAQGYKDQYCTDPRTMRKHAAYTEWADAYSCTRHRCQPGGRNLAIYTVGCKRVEAPESAIECEEVVEDTNMQFPFCCTRLRCLVVVRGEVWTRVLGQPWEVLPAAPWSHMYKMKKPPPTDTAFQPKVNEQGPVYELSEPESDGGNHDKGPRSGRKQASSTDSPDLNEVVPRAIGALQPAPDIVIALSTSNDKEMNFKKTELSRRKRGRKSPPVQEQSHFFEKEEEHDHHDTDGQDIDEIQAGTEKLGDTSEEKFYGNALGQKEKQPSKGSNHQIAWTEIPQIQWNEHEGMDVEPRANVMELRYTQEPSNHQPDAQKVEQGKNERKEDKADQMKPNLQALVDAIGTRMRDIESVVQRMSEKVHHPKSPGEPNSDKRFSVRSRGGKYHEPADITTEHPLFIEDNNYFSDASNAVRRANMPKEPSHSHPTYMAPVDNQRKSPVHIAVVSDTLEEIDRKKKKHVHKKKKTKPHPHKKHHGNENRKHFNKLSMEVDKNVVSVEDSSAQKHLRTYLIYPNMK